MLASSNKDIIEARLTLDASDFNKTLKDSEDKTESLSDSLQDGMGKLGKYGKVMTIVATVAVAYATAVAKASVEMDNFSRTLKANNRDISTNAKALGSLQKKLIGVSTKYGVSLQEIAIAQGMATRSGLTMNSSIEATGDSALLANKYNQDLTETVIGLTNGMRTFGVDSTRAFKAFDYVMSTTNATSENTADVFGELGLIAKRNNMTIEQTAILYSDMVREGYRAEEAVGVLTAKLENNEISFDNATTSMGDYNKVLGELETQNKDTDLSFDQLNESLKTQLSQLFNIPSVVESAKNAYKGLVGVLEDVNSAMSLSDIKKQTADSLGMSTILNQDWTKIDKRMNEIYGQYGGNVEAVKKYGEAIGEGFSDSMATSMVKSWAKNKGIIEQLKEDALTSGTTGLQGVDKDGSSVLGGTVATTDAIVQYELEKGRKLLEAKKQYLTADMVQTGQYQAIMKQLKYKELQEDLVFYQAQEGQGAKVLDIQKQMHDMELSELEKSFSAKETMKEQHTKKMGLIDKIANQGMESAIRNQIRTGESGLKSLAQLAIEELAVHAMTESDYSLMNAYGSFSDSARYASQMRFGSSAKAFAEGTKSLAISSAIMGVAGLASSAISGGESESVGSYDEAQDIALNEELTPIEETTESEECSYTVINGMEGFTQAFDQFLKDKHNMSVTTKIYAKRR